MKKNPVADLYEKIADKYHENRSKADNDHIEMPTVMDLLGTVEGKRILDLGCGLGGHADVLLRKGAKVTAIDASRKMIDLAKQRCKGRGTFLVGNFETASFSKESFDLILASYSIHYVKDIGHLFKKISSWLRPGGRIVFSVYHPIQYYRKIEGFDFSKMAKYWFHLRSYAVDVFNWYHPLEEYLEALKKNDLELLRIKEPCLDKKYKGFHPDQYRLPACIVFEAKK